MARPPPLPSPTPSFRNRKLNGTASPARSASTASVSRAPANPSMDERARDMNWDWVNEEDLLVFQAGIIFLVIFLQFLGYICVRQLVNIIEYFSAWRGYRGRLRLALRKASTFEEWKERALALDNYLRLSDWKRSPPNAYYDSALIRRVLRSLRELRERDDVEGVRAVLEVALRSNFAGIESFRLYSETFYGTKELVEEYVDEVARSIAFMRAAPTTAISIEEKAKFFRYAAKNLGATALCLSGGASFGYYHFGVVRALLDTGLLPRVITGTSAGAIIAAFACTRTDEELKEMLVPALADRISACEEPLRIWAARVWKTGARFDTLAWARKASFFTMGSMTFKEAYERTGRILNVSVIPYDTHSPTKLLNYLTAPDCVIYTAVIASAAVPGILNPVVLMTKDASGEVHPWEFQGKHKDGSLRVDIPLRTPFLTSTVVDTEARPFSESLHLMYNVNFSIVSQVNPHIHLFHFAPRGSPGRPVSHRSGKGWRGGFFLSAAEQFLKLELTKNFRVIRDLELLPELGGQNWSAVFLQKFEGTVTIWPKSRIWDWFRILTDPDRDELSRMIRVGQGVTWPKIKMIDNRMKIERQLDLAREEIHTFLTSPNAPPNIKRDSSFDLLVTAPSVTADPTTEEDPLDHASSDEEGETSTRVESPTPTLDEASTPANRRKQILARLGLKPGRFNYKGTTSTEASSAHEDSDFTDSGRGNIRRGNGSRRGPRRRFSLGNMKRIDGTSESEEDGLGSGGAGWDSGGSGR
ncbi:hypothetical protein P7C70_g1096, partial [Phenoliferia sp. Uapishka_3]